MRFYQIQQAKNTEIFIDRNQDIKILTEQTFLHLLDINKRRTGW